MPCDHLGPPEVIAIAESHLRAQGTPNQQWQGLRIRHAENTPAGMWASVIIEIERRGEQWIVTRLDRRAEPVTDADAGLKILS